MGNFFVNPYRRPLSPFVAPVAVPICDPDFQPVSVMVSCLWLSYIVGSLGVLQEQATWDTTDPDLMLLTIQRVNNLREIFSAAIDASACETLPVPIACNYDFTVAEAPWFINPTYNQGTYNSGVGFESSHVSGVSEQAIVCDVDYSSPVTLQHINVIIDAAAAGSGTNDSVAIYSFDGSYHLLIQYSLLAGLNTYSWVGEINAISRIEVQTNSGTAAGATHTITTIQVGLLGDPTFDCFSP